MSKIHNATERTPERHTPEYKIFKKVFCVQVANYELVSDKEVQKFGTFTTGDRRMDAQRARMATNAWLCINQMLEIYQGGGEVRLVNYDKDVKIIHGIIQEYLAKYVQWQEAKQRGGLGIHDEEKFRKVGEYCRQLDDFGKLIHTRASTTHRRLREPARVFSREDLLNRSFTDRVTERDAPRAPDYVPITERINYANLGRKKRY